MELVHGNDRKGLERLCRYIAWGSIASSRLTELPDGRVRYELARPWRDGTAAVVMTQGQLVERLLALIPRPNRHTIRYWGVFAPRHHLRNWVVRDRPKEGAIDERSSEHDAMQRVLDADAQRPSVVIATQVPMPEHWTWSKLLKRTYGLDRLECPTCGARRRVISAIQDPGVIERFLDSVGLPTGDWDLLVARGPPSEELWSA